MQSDRFGPIPLVELEEVNAVQQKDCFLDGKSMQILSIQSQATVKLVAPAE
jgi:hypothetical protein